MTRVKEPVSERERLAAGVAVQDVLPHLLALTLDARQVEWNLGDDARPLRSLAGEMAIDARGWTDRLAIRAVALGLHLDVLPGTFAAVAKTIRQFPAGVGLTPESGGTNAARGLVEVIDRVVLVAASAAERVAGTDEVAHQLITELLRHLAAYRAALLPLA